MNFGKFLIKKLSAFIVYLVFILVASGCGSDTYNTTNNNQLPLGEIILTLSNDNDFFVLRSISSSGDFFYSNSNTFSISNNGYLVDSTGLALQMFPVDSNGLVTSTSLGTTIPVRMLSTSGVPQATTTVSINAVFPSSINQAKLSVTLDSALSSNPGNPDPTSYHYPSSITIVDSLGESHNLIMFFVMTDITNRTWEIRTTIDGVLALPFSAQILDFDNSGILDITGNDGDGVTTPNSGVISYQSFSLSNGASPLNISIDFSPQNLTTTYEGSSPFDVIAVGQNGFSSGISTRLTIDEYGLSTINYSNALSSYLGKVALAKFASPSNLQPEGSLLWSETTGSGSAISGEAGAGIFGLISPVLHVL
ncbi:MAG: flagellar hook-basal body complex protein [Gammaproteobacteria bacterium]|nr:flagellar hook-basal body complex protein [Gammaproteobacteria bacterium]